MRREADRRMYDVQRRTERQNAHSAAHSRPAESCSVPSCAREEHKPPECTACAESCVQADTRAEEECCPKPASPILRLPSEELLILALILLVMSEGGNLPLVLALLYLLM